MSTNLNINGTSNITRNTWDVHFTNLAVSNGSVSGAKVTKAATLDDTLHISYNITLDKPGDYYEFTVDVKNFGTIDAKLSALPVLEGLTAAQDVYTNYTFTHTDGTDIVVGEKLPVGASKNFKVRIEYDKSITDDTQLPKTDQELNLTVDMSYEQD